jgi:4-amino-4-deoxy-L-arabinose transferase-like glycosyltransferase
MPKRSRAKKTAPVRAANLSASSPGQPLWERVDWFLVIFIVLLATTLRLLNLSFMEFKGDEAANLFLASKLVEGKDFPLIGIGSSIGTDNPPLFIYFMALPLFFSRNPVVAASLVALLNGAAVGLLYILGRRYFDRIAAVVAGGFFAVNPWAILYSRKIWQQDFLPFFVVVFFYSLIAVVSEGRQKLLVVCIACFAAMTQLHLSSIYYVIVLGIVLFWFRPRARWTAYAGGFGLALLLYAPYIVVDLLNDGHNLRILLRVLQSPSRFHSQALTTPLMLASTLGFMHFVDWQWLDLLQGALIAAGVIFLFSRWHDPRYTIVDLWACLPVFFLSWSKLDLPTHYFIVLFPVQFLMLGIVAAALIRFLDKDQRLLRYGLVGFFFVLWIYQLQSGIKFITAIENGEIQEWAEYGPEYGPPFRLRVQEIRGLIREGIVEPDRVQQELLARKSPELTFKYDYRATEYIVRYINEIPY